MAHDVFVSYHSDSSRAIADLLVQKMERSGVICWYAPRNVQEKYGRDIMDAIQGCSIFVVLLNKAASESDFVLDEIAEAKQSKRKIIVLQLTDETFSKESSLYLKRHHWVKVTESLDQAIDEVVDRALLNLGRKKNKNQIMRGMDEISEYITLNYCGETHRVKGETIQYSNGCVYIGEVVNGKRHGKGRLSWPTGDVYEGDFSEDLIHGKGKYVHASGNVYEGDYLFDKRHGMGKYTWVNGDVYEGAYSDGKKHGKGKVTWINGDVYEGNFADGKRSGYGVFKPAKGKILKGQFQDDKFIGK